MIPWGDFLLHFVPEYMPRLLDGLRVTATLTATAFLLATSSGFVLGMLRREKRRLVATPVAAYVNGVRLVPLLIWLYIAYFGLPTIGITFDSFTAAAIALGFYGSAQVAEIVRAGFEAIDRGQSEAAMSIGLSYVQGVRLVLWPQAVRIVGVGLGNYLIWLLKDTALASTVAVFELMAAARQVVYETYIAFQTYLLAIVLYLVISVTLAHIVRNLERRWTRYVPVVS